jgi:hypothetical protein
VCVRDRLVRAARRVRSSATGTTTGMDQRDQPDTRRERREVRSADPSLSREANQILTEELREVIGSDAVDVPVDRAHIESDEHGGKPRLLVTVLDNRVMFGSFFFIAIVVGLVIAVSTGSYWFVALAIAIDMIGTFIVAGVIIGLTGEPEHVSPSAAARLEDEGVEDPDRLFSSLVAEFSPEDPEAREVVRLQRAVTPPRVAARPTGA